MSTIQRVYTLDGIRLKLNVISSFIGWKNDLKRTGGWEMVGCQSVTAWLPISKFMIIKNSGNISSGQVRKTCTCMAIRCTALRPPIGKQWESNLRRTGGLNLSFSSFFFLKWKCNQPSHWFLIGAGNKETCLGLWLAIRRNDPDRCGIGRPCFSPLSTFHQRTLMKFHGLACLSYK